MKARRGSILAYILATYRTFPKVLRLGAFILFVALAISGVSLHHARAQLSESLMNLGVDMLRYEGAEHQQEPRTLVLNGQPIQIATGYATHTVEQVLDVYESRCRDHDGELTEQLDEALSRTTHLGFSSRLLDATLRANDEEHGYVACIDSGTERIELPTWIERIESFTRTLDLSDIGGMRYVFAQRYEAEGEEDVTHFITVWVEGSFDLGAMFPAEGDAPGIDLEDVPRPVRSRRLFSTLEIGHDKVLVMYETDEPKSRVVAFYKREMPKLDWLHIELTDEDAARIPYEVGRTTDDLMVFKLGGRLVSVMVMDDTSPDGKTIAAVIEM